MADTRGSYQPKPEVRAPHLYIRRGQYGFWLMCRHGDGTIEAVELFEFDAVPAAMQLEIA